MSRSTFFRFRFRSNNMPNIEDQMKYKIIKPSLEAKYRELNSGKGALFL
jgi:hypothetical protein